MTRSFELFSSAAAFLPHSVSAHANIIWHRRHDTMVVFLKHYNTYIFYVFVVADPPEKLVYKLMSGGLGFSTESSPR